MDLLPEEIIWYHFIKRLEEHDIIFVCRYIYYCYWNRISDNDKIAERFKRISEGEKESKINGFAVRLDRIYTISHNDNIYRMIQVKVFYEKSVNWRDIEIEIIVDNGKRNLMMDCHHESTAYYYYGYDRNHKLSFGTDPKIFKLKVRWRRIINHNMLCYKSDDKLNEIFEKEFKALVRGGKCRENMKENLVNCVSLIDWCIKLKN